MFNRLAPIAFALGLIGCADTAAMRTLATNTATNVTSQEGQMKDFIGAANQQNLDNAATLKALQAQTASQQEGTAQVLLAWKLGGAKDLLDAQATATQVQPADIVASLAVSGSTAATLDDGGAAANLEKANSVFVTLTHKPATKDALMELYSSGDAVYTALKAQQSSAKAPAAAPAKPTSADPAAKAK